MAISLRGSQIATDGVMAGQPIRVKLLSPYQCVFVKTNCDSLIKHQASPSGFTLLSHFSKFRFVWTALLSNSIIPKDIVVINLDVKAEKKVPLH